MQPIVVSYPLELVHLDFLTLGGKMDDGKSVNVLIVTYHFTKYAETYVNLKTDCSNHCQNIVGEFLSALWMA